MSAGDGDKDHSNVFQLIQAHQVFCVCASVCACVWVCFHFISVSELRVRARLCLKLLCRSGKIVDGKMLLDFVDFELLLLLLQEKAARLPPVEEIRTVLDHSVRGMLSTLSQVFETPF